MGQPFQLGRYALHAELAAGGMAVVYLARQTGAVGFGRTVAIKRLHPHLAKDPYFATMFLDEARLAARITHPNVVPTLDVVATDNELFLVLEYVRGETLSGLLRAARKKNVTIPVNIAAAIGAGLLAGLHAAHEARDEQGTPLNIVHRDVSPQNLIIGADGVPRVLDFGVAKAASRLQTTREGQLKGKIPYMAPEQLAGEVTARSDVYSSAVVIWETLTRQRLFRGETEAQVLHLVMTMDAAPPSSINPEVPPALDAIVLKGLARDPANRYATAREMGAALEASIPLASTMKIAEWVDGLIGPTLAARDAIRAEIESITSGVSMPAPMSSTPALPAFPQISDNSSASFPHVAASANLAGIAESTASLVVGTPAPPSRSRTPIVLAILGVGCAIGLALVVGVFVGRTPKVTNNGTAAEHMAPSATNVVTTPTPAIASSVPVAITPSAAAATTTATNGKHGGNVKVHTTPSATASSNPNDINSLLDTR